MKKKGRPKKMTNPHDKIKQEAKYLAWESGAGSKTENDNPYMDLEDPPYKELSNVWKQGFSSNKKIVVNKDINIPLETTITSTITYSDEALIKELKKRKEKEYKELIKQQEELNKKINKLKILMEL